MRISYNPVNYSAILDVYSLEQLLEFNDLTLEEALQFMLDAEFLKLPDIKPLEFE